MLGRMLWRCFESNDGAAGGAPAGQTGGSGTTGQPAASPPAEPPAPPATPSVDPAAHAALQLENARLAARVEYPQADASLIQGLTDVAAIAAVAKRTHELALAAQPNGNQPPAGGGAPVPPANATTAAEPEEARKDRELQYKVRQRVRPGARGGRTVLEPWEAEEAKDRFFQRSWNNHMEHRRTGRGNVSEPPRGAPAAAQAPALPAPGRAF